MLSSEEFDCLQRNHWVVVDSDTTQETLMAIATQLGTPVPSRRGTPIITVLKPSHAHEAIIPTFTSTYGDAAFPLHTDSAHWPLPARYVILRDIGESHDRATLVATGQDLISCFPNDMRHRAFWRVTGPYGPFVCSVVSRVHGNNLMRFDPLCMRPGNPAAIEAMEAVKQSEVPAYRVTWRKGRILVIDNWNAIHGRDKGICDDRDSRILQRVLVFDSRFLPLFPHVLAT